LAGTVASLLVSAQSSTSARSFRYGLDVFHSSYSLLFKVSLFVGGLASLTSQPFYLQPLAVLDEHLGCFLMRAIAGAPVVSVFSRFRLIF
jgi:hypothetical protein